MQRVQRLALYPNQILGPQSLLSSGSHGFYHRRESGQEADHSPPPSVQVKNVRCHTFTLPYILLN